MRPSFVTIAVTGLGAVRCVRGASNGAGIRPVDRHVGPERVEVAVGNGEAAESQIRTFDYTRDGLIICTWRNISANGTEGFVHWFTKLDGEHLPEFSRGSARHSDRTISVKKTGDYTFDIEGRLIEGKKVTFTGTVTISQDGKTMNWKVDDRRDNNTTVRVYEKG